MFKLYEFAGSCDLDRSLAIMLTYTELSLGIVLHYIHLPLSYYESDFLSVTNPSFTHVFLILIFCYGLWLYQLFVNLILYTKYRNTNISDFL